MAGIAETGRTDRGELLRGLLAGAIGDCRALAGDPVVVAEHPAELLAV